MFSDTKDKVASQGEVNVLALKYVARDENHFDSRPPTTPPESGQVSPNTQPKNYYSKNLGHFGRLAVEVTDGHLSYGRGKKAQHALRGVNLRVPEGTIYGLLGPSGCGKTTLLNAVVGTTTLDNGTVRVFEEKPGSEFSIVPGRGVGFMPQELALYPEFTIKEILHFFGRLQQIDYKTLRERTEFLIDFLHLPRKNVMVQNLSGGQQRRVSLAAALIHQPPLLVLDEPTVGVDPMLRQNIWEYLVGLATNEGMTIIITTHYIEEAAAANMVGLMRKGQLLAEASPAELMMFYHEPSLEKCFLKLCKLDKETTRQRKASLRSPSLIPESLRPAILERSLSKEEAQLPTATVKPVTNDNSHLSASTVDLINANNNDKDISTDASEMSLTTQPPNRYAIPQRFNMFQDGAIKILTLFLKNITRLKRNLVVFAFNFILPAFLVTLMCLCIGPEPKDLKLAVVNEDPARLSTRYLDSISNNIITKKPYPDFASALASVEQGKTWGVLHFGPTFSVSLMKRFREGLDASNETIENGSIRVNLDMTNQQIGYSIQKALVEAFQAFAEDLLETTGVSPALAKLPVLFQKPVYGISHGTFTEFIVPGVIISLSYYLAVGLTLLATIQEKKAGLFNRAFVSGITPFQVLASHMITQFLVLTGQVAAILCITFLVFEIPVRGPFIWVIVLIILQGCSGMTFGLLVSSKVSDEVTAVMACLASLYPSTLLTGMMWPIESQPWWLQYVSMALPQTIPTEALRSVMSRGWGVEYTVVWSSILIMSGWIIVCFGLSVLVFKLKK